MDGEHRGPQNDTIVEFINLLTAKFMLNVSAIPVETCHITRQAQKVCSSDNDNCLSLEEKHSCIQYSDGLDGQSLIPGRGKTFVFFVASTRTLAQPASCQVGTEDDLPESKAART
jgi:hypothetical protein